MSFVHLHVHSNFSFGDGACRIDELVETAAAASMTALAVTDHDGLYGAVRFYQACTKAGIKPIVGVELNVESVLSAEAKRQPSSAERSAQQRSQEAYGRRPAGEQPVRVDRPHQGYDGPLRGQTAAPGWHLVLLAQDYRGWSNLCRIISAAHLEHPGEPPYARLQTVVEHSDHLICLSSCRRGELGAAVLAAARAEDEGRRAEAAAARRRARQIAARYADVFSGGRTGAAGRADKTRISTSLGDVWTGRPPRSGHTSQSPHDVHTAGPEADGGGPGRPDPARSHPGRARYFVELQNELLPDSADYVRELAVLAHELGLPTVATNNVHYVKPEDAPLHDVLAADAANMPLPNPLGRRNAELYFKSAAQMGRLFAAYPQAVRNSARIAARCNLDLGLGRLLFPAYPLPPGETAYSLLCKKCFRGAEKRYRPVTPQVTARLEHELKVIQELGFAEYFLAVSDIVDFARSRRIPYSGRGSAGNSIVSYVLRVCDADPIEHDLLFERFLNPFRREMPDVDIDFCSVRREEVIDYIYERFGRDNVAMVATVNTAHAPSAVRVVAKAFGFRPEEIDRLSRKVPWGSAARLGEMLEERPELKGHEFQSPHYRRLVTLAEKLADYPLHLGTHLGGFILSRDPLTDRIPLQWAAKGVVVAQFDKDDIETLGLVKMDILALKMHSAIAEAVRRIGERTGVEVSPWELPKDDPKVYELIRSARTVGLFQLESSGQRNLATRLQERTFEDVIAAISLFRPGPLQADMIAPFVRRRHGHEKPAVPHPDMEPAVRGTYGVIVYQEQVISVAAAVAGFSLAEADMLRRAMTHERSMEEMDEIGRTFVEKAVARGVERPAAEEVFRQLRGFAAYGFNKAHAACFAVLCNASAWLKAHYPAEFYCGLMNNQPMGFYSPRVVLNDARRFGVPVLPLDINVSVEGFSVEMVPAGGAADAAATADGAADADDGDHDSPDSDADGIRERPALRVGLKYVKEMSTEAMHRIVAERGEVPRDMLGRPVAGHHKTDSQREGKCYSNDAHTRRPYGSLADFVERTRVGIETAENLIRGGAFKSLGTRREELLAQLPIVYAGLQPGRRGGRATTGRIRGAGPGAGEADFRIRGAAPTLHPDGEPLRLLTDQLPPLDFLPAWSPQEALRNELEVLGLNVSTHPLRFVREQIEALGCTPVARLPEVPHGRRVRLAGVLERAQMPWIRSGHRTLFLTLEDETELGQVVVFNDVYLKYGAILKDVVYLLVDGQLQNDEEHGLAVVAHQVYDLLEVLGRPAAQRPQDARTGPGRPVAERSREGPSASGSPDGAHPARPSPRGTRQPPPGPPPIPLPDIAHPASPAPGHRWGDECAMPWVEPRTRPGRTG
jgi:DNA polymerase III alpha subunit